MFSKIFENFWDFHQMSHCVKLPTEKCRKIMGNCWKNVGKMLEKVLKNFRKMLRNILQLMVKTGKNF